MYSAVEQVLRVSWCKSEAFCSLSCENKRPTKRQLWLNWPKSELLSKSCRNKNYQKHGQLKLMEVGHVYQNCSPLVQSKFWEITIFWKNYESFRQLNKKLQILSKMFSAGLSNCILLVQRNVFDDKIVKLKKYI